MQSTIPLCPVLPEYVAFAGFGLVAITPLLPLVLLYRLVWWRRYGRNALTHLGERVCGTIVGPDPPGTIVVDGRGRARVARTFALEAKGGQTIVVAPEGAVIKGWPRRVRVGQRVTVDGFPDSIAVEREHLYREPGSSTGLMAVQIARGSWPACRLVAPCMFAAWLLCLLVVVFVH
jgi:hypothetical protein